MSDDIDFWGNEVIEDKKKIIASNGMGYCQKFKSKNKYRRSDAKAKSCKTCAHIIKYPYHDKNYYKCELLGISNSETTDIRLSYVCDSYQLT